MNKKRSTPPQRIPVSKTSDSLRLQAFDTSYQANIISTVTTGRIIMGNLAARKLLGYSKKELLTKNRSTIFNIDDKRFRKMLKERKADGHSKALVTVIKKSGKSIQCEITSAVFTEGGILRSITTITNLSESIKAQKSIDKTKEKEVADNIATVALNQKIIDI